MKSMNVKCITTLNAKYEPKKKNKVVSALETVVGVSLMSFFPLMIVYCFFGILCNG
jgi:hypothetical protein